jgi:nucleoside phosphorylase
VRVGVLIAAEAEASAILADDRFAWDRTASGEFVSRSFPMRLALSGVGKVFASWACAALARDSDLMLSLGTSGGLSSERVGSLRLVKEFVEYDMDATGLGFPCGVTPFSGVESPVISSLSPGAEKLAQTALAAAGLEAPWARAASGDRFVKDAAEARALREATGASLCDMESAAEAKLCAYRAGGLDFFAFRAISDNADHVAGISWEKQVELSSRDFDAFLYAFATV